MARSIAEPEGHKMANLAMRLFIPFDAGIWAQAVYTFDRNAGVGLYERTSNATVFAPEAGKLTVFPDGTWGLEADGGAQIRTWIGISPLKGLPPNGAVFGGQPLGTAAGDFRMSLAVTTKGGGTAEVKDPTVFLIANEADFVEFQGPTQNRAPLPRPTQTPPRAPAPASHAAPTSAELAQRPTSAPAAPFDPGGKRSFSPGQVAVITFGSLLLGGLIAKGVSSR